MVERVAGQKPGGSLERLTLRGLTRSREERGASTLVTLVILVPVLFAFMGFAVDLGMMYSVKGELKAAANAMALAAAGQLIGTGTSTTAANAAAQLTIENATGFGNKYYFHGFPIGQAAGSLASVVTDPAYFSTAADAIATTAGGGGADGSLARHVRITINGQIQRLFWGFLPPLNGNNITVAASAVAGISAPLCLACGIEPLAVAAMNQDDATDYGFVLGTKYSLTYLCNQTGGAVNPPVLAGASQLIYYLLLNRYDPSAVVLPAEGTQAFRDGAGGLPGNTNSAQACFRVNNTEVIWASATPPTCGTAVPSVVTDALCGLDMRFESTPSTACASIPSIDALTAYQPDSDISDYDSYVDYMGNGRRIITIPIVDALSAGGNMTVLGFRQFLLIPNQGASNITPGDTYGRFAAMYIGSVAPVRQGRFDGCQSSAGPGKVVLHQ